jgi:hypothetical protein
VKIQLGEGKEYTVDPIVLDYLTLKYGQRMLEQYRKMDSTLQFGMKIVTKQVTKELLKAFGVSSKLPRGTDPSEFLIRAYIILMRESLDMANVRLLTDERANLVYDSEMDYEGLDEFPGRMNQLLEGLKAYAPTALSALPEPGTAEGHSDRARPELALGGEEEEREDDGWEDADSELPLSVS